MANGRPSGHSSFTEGGGKPYQGRERFSTTVNRRRRTVEKRRSAAVLNPGRALSSAEECARSFPRSGVKRGAPGCRRRAADRPGRMGRCRTTLPWYPIPGRSGSEIGSPRDRVSPRQSRFRILQQAIRRRRHRLLTSCRSKPRQDGTPTTTWEFRLVLPTARGPDPGVARPAGAVARHVGHVGLSPVETSLAPRAFPIEHCLYRLGAAIGQGEFRAHFRPIQRMPEIVFREKRRCCRNATCRCNKTNRHPGLLWHSGLVDCSAAIPRNSRGSGRRFLPRRILAQ